MKSKFMPLVVLACATIQTYAETKEPIDSLKVYSYKEYRSPLPVQTKKHQLRSHHYRNNKSKM